MIYKTIDLFAGVGGIRLGFDQAGGFETAFANDFEKNCKTTYDLNFHSSQLTVADLMDIRSADLPKYDFLLGGFPCQPFSIAGYRHGFNDRKGRGNLFFKIAEIIEDTQPQGFLLENVKNLATHDSGRTYKIIKETLENLGYTVQSKVLNSKDYGNVPQNRERVYIVGFKDKFVASSFKFPAKQELTTELNNFLESQVDDKYYYNNKPLYSRLKPGVKEKGVVYQWRRQYVRENKSGVCPTLTANMGTGGHNVPIIKDDKGIRKLTPKECFLLQGFPEAFVLPKDIAVSQLYKQAGNSVTVPVVKRIATNIRKALELSNVSKRSTKKEYQSIH